MEAVSFVPDNARLNALALASVVFLLTLNLMYLPASDDVRRYEELVAPEISDQVVPLVELCHCLTVVALVASAQVPSSPVRVLPME